MLLSLRSRRVDVYRCPVHGLIESPRFFGPPYTVAPEEEGMFCPINLSTDESGITDDVCDERCIGPFTVIYRGRNDGHS